MPALILRGARVARADAPPARLDILIGETGRIDELAPQIRASGETRVVDLQGKLVVPGLVDAHQHLDKTRTLARIQNPKGDLYGAIDAFRRYAATMSVEDVAARAERTMAACLARGTVAIRSHANVDPDALHRGVEALVGLRNGWRERLRLQVVAFRWLNLKTLIEFRTPVLQIGGDATGLRWQRPLQCGRAARAFLRAPAEPPPDGHTHRRSTQCDAPEQSSLVGESIAWQQPRRNQRDCQQCCCQQCRAFG